MTTEEIRERILEIARDTVEATKDNAVDDAYKQGVEDGYRKGLLKAKKLINENLVVDKNFIKELDQLWANKLNK